jgi:hypothetical protein
MSYFDTRFRLLTNILRSATRVEQSGRFLPKLNNPPHCVQSKVVNALCTLRVGGEEFKKPRFVENVGLNGR